MGLHKLNDFKTSLAGPYAKTVQIAGSSQLIVPVNIPLTASAVVGGIGVDVHYAYTDTTYFLGGNNNNLIAFVQELGVSWIRDGIPKSPGSYTAAFLNAMASSGVKTQLVCCSPAGGNSWGPGESANLVAALKSAPYLNNVSALEGPNEWDIAGGNSWFTTLLSIMSEYYQAVRADSSLNSIAFNGPSLAYPYSYATYYSNGGSDNNLDAAIIHPYAGGGPAESGFLSYWLSTARQLYGSSRAILASETGYHNALASSDNQGVDELSAATYLIRTIISYASVGVSKTFIYELFDEIPRDAGGTDPQQHFGLVAVTGNSSDTTTWVQRRKPAFTALKALISRLKDTGSGTPKTSLTYSFSNTPEDFTCVPISRKDGSVDLAVWRTGRVYDTVNRKSVSVATKVVTLTLQAPSTIKSYRPNDTIPTEVNLATGAISVQIPVDANVTLVRVL